ncbi:hypothetical protein LTR91_000295 [Friedmanniomyces endolithicus]|uniref:F-box domain-containing protein n=1 Tax=Friedmanniomyces endolithicus TaxID=329885 RepID=A0AAN6R2Z0_9PEZI|nr:hypothetical protein LTS01_001553 [Friedmanniomyces endolithicus]KAK1016275.1 hypothetical protein LTR91_000295 [Friedmanniomyces endolithicus]KAK1054670.1 hypothetical protein LTS16_000315 [Friedmanniomyces endolithicus]
MSAPALLVLPPELRELILVALLAEGEPISLQQSFTEPAISKVCRLLRKEALSVFYHDNTFCVDNSGGRVEATRKLNGTLTRMHPANLACIRRLRLDWNIQCQANSPACFSDQHVPIWHKYDPSDTSWSAPRYMVACYLTFTTQEPWVELSVGYYNNKLCNMTAKSVYEGMSGILLPTLIGPLATGQRRKQLTPIYFTKLVEVWQSLAAHSLSEKCSELQIRRLAAFNHPVTNRTLRDFQMQLMLLEQQNKKRLLMAREEQDSAGFHPPSTHGANDDSALQDSRTVSSTPVAGVPSRAGKEPSKIVKRKAPSRAGAQQSRVTR